MDRSSQTLEQRLTLLEIELRKANARVRALEGWRRRSFRSCFLTLGGVAALLLVFALVVPTPGIVFTNPTRITAPFHVVNAAGKPLLTVVENKFKTGGVVSLLNTAGAEVVQLGINTVGVGLIVVKTPDAHDEVLMGLTEGGNPILQLNTAGKAIASLGLGKTNMPVLELHNNQGAVVAKLEAKEDTGAGHLVLANEAGISRAEAGTETNGNGAVRVYGPTGKCKPCDSRVAAVHASRKVMSGNISGP